MALTSYDIAFWGLVIAGIMLVLAATSLVLQIISGHRKGSRDPALRELIQAKAQRRRIGAGEIIGVVAATEHVLRRRHRPGEPDRVPDKSEGDGEKKRSFMDALDDAMDSIPD